MGIVIPFPLARRLAKAPAPSVVMMDVQMFERVAHDLGCDAACVYALLSRSAGVRSRRTTVSTQRLSDLTGFDSLVSEGMRRLHEGKIIESVPGARVPTLKLAGSSLTAVSVDFFEEQHLFADMVEAPVTFCLGHGSTSNLLRTFREYGLGLRARRKHV